EPPRRHPHQAGRQRDHGAQRAEEAAEEDALAAVAREEVEAVREKVWMSGERPEPLERPPIALADAVGHAVAEDGAGNRPQEYRPQRQDAARDERTSGHKECGAREKQAQKSERLAEADHEHDRPRPDSVPRDEVEQGL